MISQVKPLRSLLLAASILGHSLLGLSSLQADTMIDGSAIVTTHSGSVIATDASGQNISANAHDSLLPAGLELSTQEDGQFFITMSNGVALALSEDTSAKFIEYTQRPFDLNDQSEGPEPSVSNLRLQLIKGQIAIATNRLSPLSELRIRLPKGEIRLHKGTCLISLDAAGLHLTAFEGNLTYYYPDAKGREFVAAPKRIRISEQSMALQQIADTSTADSLEPEAKQFCLAVQHASQRVTFQPNEATGLPPVPILIVRPEYFEQTPMRPYRFQD
jgi:hypothetical protein